MSRKKILGLSIILVTLIVVGTTVGMGLVSAFPHYTSTDGRFAFTYQGLLQDADGPANGSCDFEFRLFDDPAGGAQVGDLVSRNGVVVTDGRFTTELNFDLFVKTPRQPGARWG